MSRQIKCPKCGKEFARIDNLNRHLKNVDCGKGANLSIEDYKKIAEKVLEEMPERERLEVQPPKKGNLKPETWLLQLSDFHYGLRVLPVEVGGLAEYNTAIAKERLEYLAETMARLLEYYPMRPKELVIAFLGDMVEGSVMRGNQQASIEHGVITQTMLVSELLTDFIVSLTKYFPRIKCYGVYGNHGRLTKSPTDSHPVESFDRMVYYIVKDRIKGVKGVTVEFTEAQHMIVRIGQKKFWLEHGDTVRAWTGIPFYGGAREKASINDMLAHFGEHADYFLVAHHHKRAIFDNIFFNGSFPGGDLYSVGRLRRMTPPSQNLFGVNGERGVVWERPLFLTDKAEEVEVKIYE